MSVLLLILILLSVIDVVLEVCRLSLLWIFWVEKLLFLVGIRKYVRFLCFLFGLVWVKIRVMLVTLLSEIYIFCLVMCQLLLIFFVCVRRLVVFELVLGLVRLKQLNVLFVVSFGS